MALGACVIEYVCAVHAPEQRIPEIKTRVIGPVLSNSTVCMTQLFD